MFDSSFILPPSSLLELLSVRALAAIMGRKDLRATRRFMRDHLNPFQINRQWYCTAASLQDYLRTHKQPSIRDAVHRALEVKSNRSAHVR